MMQTATFDLQPTLENDRVKIVPLKADDFEALYSVASDPLLWEQHPNKDRYKREAFETFFKGAMESKGAFVIYDAQTNAVIGSTRFYDYDEVASDVKIGYTFIARSHWGGTYNTALKTLMLNYAFQFVRHVIFQIGAVNTRSQKAIEKLVAEKIGKAEMAYYGEPVRLNYIYRIVKDDWERNRRFYTEK